LNRAEVLRQKRETDRSGTQHADILREGRVW
jgi:hypothetical protein